MTTTTPLAPLLSMSQIHEAAQRDDVLYHLLHAYQTAQHTTTTLKRWIAQATQRARINYKDNADAYRSLVIYMQRDLLPVPPAPPAAAPPVAICAICHQRIALQERWFFWRATSADDTSMVHVACLEQMMARLRARIQEAA